jgi:chemotaxis protein methyltransferase CheR
MREYTENYIRAGGGQEFSQYYESDGAMARFDPALREQVVFAQHNLVSDGPFNEFHVIVCRNVMIYFGRELQDRVHKLFFDSLQRLGVIALGHKESLRFTPHEDRYEELDARERLYRRMR